MGILSWIIFGLIAGILAKWIMPGKDGGGFFMTILLGIVGAVVGGWISTLFGFGKVDGFNFWQLRGCRYWCDCRAIYLQED
ncbi:putative inner membrane protein [Escherichia coli TA271]|nr:putative inner membrane protein [Escherichia coli TA271]